MAIRVAIWCRLRCQRARCALITGMQPRYCTGIGMDKRDPGDASLDRLAALSEPLTARGHAAPRLLGTSDRCGADRLVEFGGARW